ncbi:hypothetical protein J4E93_010522 [Alternaria ventricosa]|uniref:uncharacterized protein n=1 Tax=Alternaria ventricosa TaxID=1187951 RepID=UPI0020C3F155|nr:uncharacterized protein J4E93_010522 [Alternaria ventricosa]KAI4638054.1 hypothetical protein J4E93_010522 [Alternaria ventricosa]
MDPFRNTNAVSTAKATTLHTTPSSTPFNTLPAHSSSYQSYQEDSSAPPAYHTVVDPTLPIPNMTNPYDPQEEDCDTQETPDDTPEITINAATQIRGHGNIISIAQMDSVRIANLIATVLSGEAIEMSKTGEEDDAAGRPITPESPTTQATARGQCTSTTQVRGVKRYSNINITVNCGATIIGDRNIVGPGLGDIARQMQMAQRNQAVLLAQQRMQQQNAAAAAAVGGQAQRMSSPPLQQRNLSPNGVLFPMKPATPPMSRSSSLNSEVGGGGRKRKCEDGGEGAAAKRRG